MLADLSAFADIGLTPDLLAALLAEHERDTLPRLQKHWAYYRNSAAPAPVAPWSDASVGGWVHRPVRLAQEQGLPPRLRGARSAALDDRAAASEIVIENDIAWRIDAMVDFVFGRPVRIRSASPDERLRSLIDAALDAAWESSGGIALLQDMALLGAVYGFADLLINAQGLFSDDAPGDIAAAPGGAPESAARRRVVDAARRIRIQLVEAPRAIPLLDPGDYRSILAYIIRTTQLTNDTAPTPAPEAAHAFAGLWRRRGRHAGEAPQRRTTEVIEIWSAAAHRVYRDGAIVASSGNPLGEVPVVHIQNSSQPFRYAGMSDVEPLIPLQDELNTRLSDRAHRVTLQSFNMYLAKGLDLPGVPAVRPGQVWITDNPDAEVHSFGGDAHAPGEEAHIAEVREAMDKASGVSPVVLGIVREKLGHLSSENAIRITLMGVLSRTARKRVAYGRGIAAASALILKALDAAGILPTREEDRAVNLKWLDPLPMDEREQVRSALLKRDLGVPVEELLHELGYAET